MGAAPSTNRKVTAQDRAILDMKLQRDKLHQYQRRIQAVLTREREIAIESLRAGNKQRALLALRRRKYQESLLRKTDEQLETLEKLTQTIEFSLVERDVLFGLKQGNEVLKQIQKEMSLESVERLMDETAEAVAYQKEVGEMLAGVITNADEEEVQEEMERIEREEKVRRGEVVDVGKMPEVPEEAPKPAEGVETREEETEEPERREAIPA